jgi:cob(I)alamin adenosyltransferase
MAKRLTRIYTRNGDGGETRLGEGTVIAKDHLRVEAMGNLDELNSVIGIILCEAFPSLRKEALVCIQHDLFNLGGELCLPGESLLSENATTWLEKDLDAMNQSLADLEEFILPGGCTAAATTHLARTVCRRAERTCVALSKIEPVRPELLAYLNRLSDWLFVLARDLNRHQGVEDVKWKNPRRPSAE